MKRWVERGMTLLIAIVAAIGAAGPARADWIVVPPRAGQLGIGLQGQYGTLLKSGEIGNEFGNGPGFGLVLRYRMRYERAAGLTFEGQQFDVRSLADSATASKRMSVYTYGFDVYQMFGTRTRTTSFVSAGAGLAQFRRTLTDAETQFSDNDGAYVSVGAGFERFVWQSWALQGSAKYLSIFQNGKANHDLQATLGVIVYASY